MPRQVVEIDPIELSLGERPKNRRRFLIMKDEEEATQVAEEEEAKTEIVVEEAEAVGATLKEDGTVTMTSKRLKEPEGDGTESSTEEKSEEAEEEPISYATATEEETVLSSSEATAEILHLAHAAVIGRSFTVPRAVRDAVELVMRRGGMEVPVFSGAFGDEGKVYIKSLLGLIPEEAPEDVAEAAEALKAWVDEGYEMCDMPTEQPTAVVTYEVPRQRVVRSEKLIAVAEEMAAELMTQGLPDLVKEIMGFAKAIKKALPQGGLVVVAGVVPADGDYDIANLADIWKSENPNAVAVVQQVVDAASISMLSATQKAQEEATEILLSFAADVGNAVGSELDKPAKLEQIQNAFNGLGAKIFDLVEQSTGEVEDKTVKVLREQVADLSERLTQMEGGPRMLPFEEPKKVEVSPAKPASARRSLIPAGDGASLPARQERTVGEIVEGAARKRFGTS